MHPWVGVTLIAPMVALTLLPEWFGTEKDALFNSEWATVLFVFVLFFLNVSS